MLQGYDLPDFENMHHALTIMKDFTKIYPQYEKEKIENGIRFSVYRKPFLRARKLVANLDVTLIQNCEYEYIHENFDDKYLLFTSCVLGNIKETFVSNYLYLKVSADLLYDELSASTEGMDLYDAMFYITEGLRYKDLIKELDIFE